MLPQITELQWALESGQWATPSVLSHNFSIHQLASNDLKPLEQETWRSSYSLIHLMETAAHIKCSTCEIEVGVYGFLWFQFWFSFLPKPKTPRCACVTTHAVFVSWWPLAAVRFMSLIPGSAPSIHFAAVLSSQPNIKLLPMAQNAASQGDVCIWHHVLSGDQPEMNNRCPWLHHCCWMSLHGHSICAVYLTACRPKTHHSKSERSGQSLSVCWKRYIKYRCTLICTFNVGS